MDRQQNHLNSPQVSTIKIQREASDPTLEDGSENLGLKKRYSFTRKSMIVDLSGPIFCDIFFSDRLKLLLNQVDDSIKLTPNRSSFCLMSAEASADYKIVLQSAVLKVRTVKVNAVNNPVIHFAAKS